MNKILGLAVLKAALTDLVSPVFKHRNRESDRVTELAIITDAKEFFFVPERRQDLEAWCALADVNPDFMVSRAKYVLTNQINIDREAAATEARRIEQLLDDEGEVH